MKRIVIINDDADFLDAIKIFLKDTGYSPRIIHESKSAYKKVRKIQPDLVILDIRMEGPEAGWKILDLLTLDEKTSHIPVIICTAVTKFPEGKEAWLEEHGILVLPKPFDVNDLIAVVEKSLGKKRVKVATKTLN